MNIFIKLYITLFFFAFLICSKVSVANTIHKVKSLDNLNVIVSKYYKSSGLTKDQLLVAVLAENPDAFSRGNINALRLAKDLLLPEAKDLQVMDSANASSLVAKHNIYFKERRKKTLAPPFASYSPSKKNSDVTALQQSTQKLQKGLSDLGQESKALANRIKILLEVKQRKDQQLRALENKIKEAEGKQQ